MSVCILVNTYMIKIIVNVGKVVWLVGVGFYGISAIVGYLMQNPVYTYISYISK